MTLPETHGGAALSDTLDVQFDGPVPVLRIPDHPEFKVLRAWLRDAVPERLATIGGRACRLDLGERAINLFDVRRLLNLLREEFQLDVTGMYVDPGELHAYAERELKLKLFGLALDWEEPSVDDPTDHGDDVELHAIHEPEDEVLEVDPADETEIALANDDSSAESTTDGGPEGIETRSLLDTPVREVQIPKPDLTDLNTRPEARANRGGRRTLNVHRTLRSGATVQFEGDVVIYGDVNAGAQVLAAGNIMVLGAMRGMAHAGAMGDETAFILGFSFRPLQLRIGRRIAIPPKRPSDASFNPEVCHVIDERIVIESFRGRIPGRTFSR